ncbi:hypothetical protein CAY53_11170 [Desulfobulbus oralis]|uniref:Uncharacterized protein n=1 Tax=Desulfobulbus oralis TaxID=1986146 RepID=A0A2L1GQR4_9BACT|nr:hypothetical protein CAY53_11170 [Desulfobulbus oralis]
MKELPEMNIHTQYSFSFACCKTVIAHGAQSPSLIVLAKFIMENNNCRLWAFYLLSATPVVFNCKCKLKQEAKRCNNKYPGRLIHMDCRRLPLLKGQDKIGPREYMYVAIDSFNQELYAAVTLLLSGVCK